MGPLVLKKIFTFFVQFFLFSLPAKSKIPCSPRLTTIAVTLILPMSPSLSSHLCGPSSSVYKQAKISLPILKEHSLDILPHRLSSILFSLGQPLERNLYSPISTPWPLTQSYACEIWLPAMQLFNNIALAQITMGIAGYYRGDLKLRLK